MFYISQVVTVLPNMSGVDLRLDKLVDSDAIHLLVQFLYLPPHGGSTEAELAAFEHIQQKAAIAVTNFVTGCRDCKRW